MILPSRGFDAAQRAKKLKTQVNGMKLLGNLDKGLLFVMSAPAGTGKTTLTQMLVDEFPCIVQSVSYTTRQPRNGEKEGYHYSYLSEQEFKKCIERDEFLEYAQIYDNYYGTSKEWVQNKLEQGMHVILVIDTQGAMQVRKKCHAPLIFIKPPSLQELRQRLTIRQTESIDTIEKRLNWAKHELEAEKEYDYVIVNDNLEIAYQVLRSILIAEEHKVKRSNHGK